jgi:hypothetical protein
MKNRPAVLEFDAHVLETIPNLDAVEPEIRAASNDAAETMIFARQLETVKSRIYEKKYEALKARSFVPESNEGGATSETLVVRIWDAFVVAKVMHNYATDIPMVSASAVEKIVRYFNVKDGYYYSIEDLRKASAAGVALTTRLGDAARRGIELARDGITAFGVPDIGTYGLANHPNATLKTLPNGAWATASGEEILEDLNYLVTSMLVDTKEIFSPNAILVSTAAWRILATKLLSVDNASNATVLSSFQMQNPGISIDSWTKLSTASADGTAGRVICYHKSPEVLEFETGIEFEILPVEYAKGVFTHVCQARYAGVNIYYPLAVEYSDNQLV